MTDVHAVLTGDLIGSTGAGRDRIERSIQTLKDGAAIVEGGKHNGSTRFTQNRSDGWQIYLEKPGDFLWVAVYLNAVLKADPQCLPTRIAIGLGTLDSLGEVGLASATGTAFTYSGQALDRMVVVGQNLVLAGKETDKIMHSNIAFVDDRVAGWSKEQAEAIALSIRSGFGPHSDIAQTIGISRQAVGARLKSSGFLLVYDAIDAFRQHDWAGNKPCLKP